MTENEAMEMLERTKWNCGLPEQGEKWSANRETIAIDMAIKALEEIQKYRSIGTVEECRAAVEKQRAKKPEILREESVKSEGQLYVAKYFKCPTCGNTSTYFGGLPNNCHNCGQSLEGDTP